MMQAARSISILLVLLGCTICTPVTDTRLRVPVPNQNAIDRQAYWRQVRGNVDQKQVARAMTLIQMELEQRDGTTRDAGISAWDDMGPANIGGRIRAIVIDPNDTDKIFIGGAAGGIWRSLDAGASWSLTTPAPLSYPVTSFAMDPTDSNVLYATTGEFQAGNLTFPGIGILKSTDGGATWNILPAPPGMNFFWLAKVVINPLDTDILYAVGSAGDVDRQSSIGVLYRSDDAGTSWQLRYTESINPTSLHIYDIDLNPADTSELLLGTGTQALISNDSGNSFSSFMGAAPPLITTVPLGTGQRCEIAYCPGTPATIYCLRNVFQDADNDGNIDTWIAELWQTVNGGTNWIMLTSTQGANNSNGSNHIFGIQGNYDNILWVDPADCTQALLGGINLWSWSSSTLTRISNWSDDIGGNTLGNNNSVHADQHAIVEDPGYDGNTNTRVYIGNDGGIYKSDDIWSATQNSGWSSLVSGLNITQMKSVDVSLTGDTLVGGSQDNSYFVERTGNSNSQNWLVYSTGDGGHGAIKKSDPEIMYSSIQNGNFMKSTDGGDSFCEMLTLSNNNFNIPNCGSFTQLNDAPLFYAPFEMDPNDDETLYAGALQLWQSTDEGVSWNAIKTDVVNGRQISTIEIADGDTNLIAVGYDNGQIWITTAGGSPWQQIDVPAMPGVFITDIAINPNDHQELMVTFGGGYDNDVVWYTDDQGAQWEDRSLSFNMMMHSVIWHPENPDWIYVGTDLGIFASENDGNAWSVTPLYPASSGNAGEGPIFIGVVELVWQGDGSDMHPYYLVAATHGRGVWKSASPIRLKYYVDKTCNPCGLGSMTQPFATFAEAVESAGHGSEIVFLTGGTYDEVAMEMLIEKRLKVTLDSGSGAAVIE